MTLNSKSLSAFVASLMISGSALYASTTTTVYDMESNAFATDYLFDNTNYSALVGPFGGLNSVGSLIYLSGPGVQSIISATSQGTLSHASDSLSFSLYFNYQDISPLCQFALALTNSPLPTMSATGVQNTENYLAFGLQMTTGGIVNSEVGTGLASLQTNPAVILLTGEWYKISLSVSKTTLGTYDLAWALDHTDSTGLALDNLIANSLSNVSLAFLDTGIFTEILAQQNSSGYDIAAVDNVTVQVDAVPEPSTFTMFAGTLGILAGVNFLRRRMQ